MMKYKFVLFDWNGTLLDDLKINIEIEKTLLKRRNLPSEIKEEKYLESFGFPIIDFYKTIGFDFSKESYEAVACEYAVEYEKSLCDARLFEDVLSLLEELKKEGFVLVIISATEHELLFRQTEKYSINSYFKTILGTSNNLGKSKVQTALDWLRKENADPEETLFIGDTVHDFETAEAIGCDCFLVSRGHNSRRRLEETGCKVFSSLEEVKERLINK